MADLLLFFGATSRGLQTRPARPMARRGVFARIAASFALAIGLVASDGTAAATTTGTLGVTARVGGNCRFNPASATTFTLALGTYTPGSGNVSASTTFRLQCSSGVPFQIALGGGGSGNVASRRMAATGAPAETLAYQLYTDVSYATVWGDGTGGTNVRTGVGTPQPQAFTIFGRIADAGANLAVAPRIDYRDDVTITITY